MTSTKQEPVVCRRERQASGQCDCRRFECPVYVPPAAAQRKPMTDEHIDKLWVQHIPSGMNGTEWRRRFVRFLEAAHGIKENA